MNKSINQTQQIQSLIEQMKAGNPRAREELIQCTWERLIKLTRKIAHDYPNLKRWEQTNDVLQNASIRLWKALDKVELNDPKHFLRLAAEKIRFELIDLARHYYGPLGQGRNHMTQRILSDDEKDETFPLEPGVTTIDPGRIAQWTDIHTHIENLEDQEKEIFDLLWYNDLSQNEAAEIIGVDVRTIKRRWRRAKLSLKKKME